MKEYKRVEWSYPTSDNAKQFGFYKSGCYTVETSTLSGIPTAIRGFATQYAAMEYALILDQEWHPLFLRLRSDWITDMYAVTDELCVPRNRL